MYPEPITIEEGWEIKYKRLRGRVIDAAAILDFEANLGDPKRSKVLRDVVRRLAEALED